MQALHHSSSLVLAVLLAMGTTSVDALFAAASWGQPSETQVSGSQESLRNNQDAAQPSVPTAVDRTDGTANNPTMAGEIPSPIATLETLQLQEDQVASPSTVAEDLQPIGRSPDVLDQDPLLFNSEADLVAQWADPTAVGNALTFRIGSRVPVPTALQGVTRPRVVLPGSNWSSDASAIVRVEQPFADGALALEVQGGARILAFDLGYNSDITDPRQGFGINIFNQRSFFPAFRGGDRNVDLPNGEEPWLHRLGGGVEYYLPVAREIDAAIGVSYQRVSVRDDLFTSDVEPIDELGNRLTVDGDGIDDLITLNIVAIRDTRDDRLYPTTGSTVRFGIDQGLTLGSRNVAFNRIGANFTQYIPFSLFGFSEGPRTLVLNLQGGGIIGDVPPYEGFNLGGVNSVRGFDKGEVGTGTRFVQATAEYRFPIFSFNVEDEDIDVGGTLFVDYATDLGSGDDVIGEPAEARDKPGDGFGFGVGLRIRSPIGPIRAELGFGDDGDSVFYFTTSNRF